MKLPVPTDPDVRAVLDRQVLVMFELAEDVLSNVTLKECLHKPSPASWTVHKTNGRWFGELADEPPDLPVPTLAWTMWHPIWWLSVLLANSRREEAPDFRSIEWPGPDSSLPTIRHLWTEWTEHLDGLDESDLHSDSLTGFPYNDRRPFVFIAGWASMELTKNLTEMCCLRRLIR